jgi:hypothetical protein
MSWDALPMLHTVITRVETLAKGQPEQQLTFTDREGCAIGDARLTGVGVNRDLINNGTNKEGDHQSEIDLNTPIKIKDSHLDDIVEYNANYDPPTVNN